MLKQLGTKILTLSVFLLTIVASTNAASACNILGYQPKLPDQLKDL